MNCGNLRDYRNSIINSTSCYLDISGDSPSRRPSSKCLIGGHSMTNQKKSKFRETNKIWLLLGPALPENIRVLPIKRDGNSSFLSQLSKCSFAKRTILIYAQYKLWNNVLKIWCLQERYLSILSTWTVMLCRLQWEV